MHIPVKVDYGVRALIDLALRADMAPIRATDIAQRTAIPGPYLDHVLHSLSKRGLVRSHRGPHGGHALAMPPSEIRLSMVMESLGSAEMLIGCLDDLNICVHVPSCAQREIWRKVDEAVFSVLDSTTIADLVEQTHASAASMSVKAASRHPKPAVV